MKHIIETLEQVEQMVGSLAERGALDIERDLLLEKIRKIYAEVLKLEPAKEEPQSGVEEQVVVVPVVSEAEFAFEPEDVVEEAALEEEPAEELAEESAEELAEESVEEEFVADEPIVEEPIEEEPIEEEIVVAEEPAEEEPIEESEVDVADGVLALYDDEEESEEIFVESEEEEPAEEPEEEDEFLIEDTEEVEQLEEKFDFEDEENEFSGSVSLRSTIGVNDKIILMRDLFNGNNEYYDRVITKLDSFSSLDEAMIFIHDNYHWNPQSEGARLLVELLARKLF